MNDTLAKTKSAFQFTKALTELVNARTRLEVVANEDYVHRDTKRILKIMLTGLNNTVNQFRNVLGEDYLKIFDEQVLDMDVALQVENMGDMIVDLPVGIRNQIESYIEGLHRVYSQK